MNYVIDASVAVKWFFNEPLRTQAKEYFSEELKLLAPELIQQEFANAIVKKVRYADVKSEDGWQACHNLFQSKAIQLIPTHTLLERAYILAVTIEHSLYDCIYLAAAEKVNAEVVTADQKFYNRTIQHTPYSSLIRWVETPPDPLEEE